VHRDLKLSNVFLQNGHYKLGDFGFAIEARQPFRDVSIGSPLYMSPEGLIHHVYGPKTDIWSFGILIYELLHGKTPL
jgi:serine/threonine protein kinase